MGVAKCGCGHRPEQLDTPTHAEIEVQPLKPVICQRRYMHMHAIS